MHTVDYQPELHAWNHLWRLLVVLLISGLAWYSFAAWQWEHDRVWFFSDVALGLLSLGLMFWRRRWPVRIALVVSALNAVSATAGGPATLVLTSLATRRRWREIVPVAVVSFAASVWLNHVNPTSKDSWVVALTAIVSIIGVTIGWGLYIGSRRELLSTLRERAERAESEQSARLEQARLSERSRIAREMHDVLAHRISLVSMHAGALTFRTDLSREQIRDAAAVIEENSHLALTELREVLGILRDDPGDAAPELPQPSAADIARFIEQARATGLKVVYRNEANLSKVPDSVGRAVFRIVQEGLTNVRKHAPDTLITLWLRGSPTEGLSVDLRNPLHIGDARLNPPESGLGLIGLAERTALAGGTLSHTITPDRQFVLHAWLPWPA